ncbi:MAG: hypothetical protein CMO26_05320 [Thiotrichales bacterium]|nr:hypothetical protein [Thiotrichales bacterium]
MAVGLGAIELRSALNEPLDATISLRAVKPGDVDDMRVVLADKAMFERAGVDRPFQLTDLQFRVIATGESSAEIRVITARPVSEPFLNFLIDLRWAQGRIIREYTVLLDPPVYGSAIRATVEQTTTTVEVLPKLSELEPDVVELDSSGAATTTGFGTASASSGSYGPVKATDTLWSLAQNYRPDGSVTVQQTMMAMLRSNPQAFGDNNINNLKAGSVLRIPSKSEINQQSAAAALADVRQQHALWKQLRQSVSAAPESTSTTGSTTTPESGASSNQQTASTTDAQAEPEADDSRLEVVGSGTNLTGATGSSADLEALQAELSLAQEQADIQRRRNEDLESKRKTADELIEKLQRLIDVKDDEIADLQNRLSQIEEELEAEAASAPATEIADSTDTAAAATGQVDETAVDEQAQQQEKEKKKKKKKKKKTVPQPPPEPPTFLQSILGHLSGNPLVWAAGAGGVVLLAILGVLLARRSKSKGEWVDVEVPEDLSTLDNAEPPTVELEADDDDDKTALPPAAIASDGIADEDATMPPEQSVETFTQVPADEDDPLEGLNVYLAYEDYDNATKLVEGVIAKYPERHEYKLRLLEIYLASRDAGAFEAAARQLQDAVGADSPLMENAHRWWADLSRGSDLFAESGGEAGPSFDESAVNPQGDESIFDVAVDTDGRDTGAGVDFDLGFEFESADLGDGNTHGVQTVDFDLGDDTGSAQVAAPADADAGVEFELAGGTGEVEAAGDGRAVSSEDPLDLDFDILLDGIDADGDADDGLELDLDLADDLAFDSNLDDMAAIEKPSGETPEAAAEADDAFDFDLDLDETGGSPATVATADADLDFALDLDDTGEVQAMAAEPTADGSDEADDFSLDLDVTGGLPSTESEPALAESATDDMDFALDLDDTAGLDSSAEAQATTESTAEIDFVLDVGDSLDFNLDLDADTSTGGETDTGSDAPYLDFNLDMDGDESSGAPDFGTVQLSTEHLTRVGAIEDNDTATVVDRTEGIEIDRDFADIFDESPQLDTELSDSAAAGEEADVPEIGLDMDLGGEEGSDGQNGGYGQTQYMLRDIASITSDDPPEDDESALVLSRASDGEVNEMQTKLDLAQAYIDMGDTEGARSILGEVMTEGSDEQQTRARELLTQLN